MNRAEMQMAIDPVCGMTVDPNAGKPSYAHGGHTYHFCSDGCRLKFAADPDRYLNKQGEPEPLPKGTLYTCPMHPQIVQEGPGPCPICGMALEPMGVPPEHEHGGNAELIDFTRRLWVAAPLSLALVALDMGSHMFGLRPAAIPRAAGRAMAEARPRRAGGAVVRLAVLRARLRLDPLGLAQYVHPDRARHRRGVSLQPGRNAGAGTFPDRHARHAWPDPDLFRGGRRHRHARAGRPGARASGAREDRRRHSRFARPRAQDRATRVERRQDRDGGARLGQGRRCVAREARRQGADRRHRHRGTQRRR